MKLSTPQTYTPFEWAPRYDWRWHAVIRRLPRTLSSSEPEFPRALQLRKDFVIFYSLEINQGLTFLIWKYKPQTSCMIRYASISLRNCRWLRSTSELSPTNPAISLGSRAKSFRFAVHIILSINFYNLMCAVFVFVFVWVSFLRPDQDGAECCKAWNRSSPRACCGHFGPGRSAHAFIHAPSTRTRGWWTGSQNRLYAGNVESNICSNVICLFI